MNTNNSMTNSFCAGRITACLGAALAIILGALTASALPQYGLDCRSCHAAAKNGMTLSNFQTQTNLGAGLFKVFVVTAGQAAAIQFSVTNDYGANYALNVNGLSNPGVNNSAHVLTYTPDAAWTVQSGGTYFTVGPTAISPNVWTFNLGVDAITPADFYPLQTQMAGSGGGLWSQIESFYVQVVTSATAPQPTLLSPEYTGTAFSVNVATTSGSTYYLEYKTDFATGTWSVATQAPGDGTVKTLTDTAATDSQRFYRVRVQ